MAVVLSVSGSPSRTSRTTRLLRHVDARLAARGHEVVPFEVRSLPAEALLAGDVSHPEIAAALELFAQADGVVIGTPVYKAAYSGLLKTLLDVLPQYALTDKAVLPLATGGSTAHVLAVDYALRPVLSSMGAGHITQGWFVLDRHITVREDGVTVIERETDVLLTPVVDGFASALERRGELAVAR
ncbi:NADPH-dependent FMN reductase [Kitasatospora sp. NPDC057223]|jgi:FMN reductase|uniref:NADPH-dependent FMN reductase n=1 Tax=Kitasatospora sp. NPDC057223 TaxID=3346055 RepID=UPI003637E4E1